MPTFFTQWSCSHSGGTPVNHSREDSGCLKVALPALALSWAELWELGPYLKDFGSLSFIALYGFADLFMFSIIVHYHFSFCGFYRNFITQNPTQSEDIVQCTFSIWPEQYCFLCKPTNLTCLFIDLRREGNTKILNWITHGCLEDPDTTTCIPARWFPP